MPAPLGTAGGYEALESADQADAQIEEKKEKEIEEEAEDPAQSDFSPVLKQSLDRMQGLNKCDAFLDLVSKEEISHVIFIDTPDDSKVLKFVTMTNQGFIKMNEVDME